MKWLAGMFLFGLCLTMLSCSSLSSVFLHNDTTQSIEYALLVDGAREPNRRGTLKGVVQPGDATEVFTYFADSIARVRVSITQLGKSRSEDFGESDLPESLSSASSGGNQSYIRVTDSAISISSGSGNIWPDFQNGLGLWLIPCVWLTLFFALAMVVTFFKRRKVAPVG